MEFTRLFDIPRYQLASFPQEDCLVGNYAGTWKKFSTQEFVDQADQASLAFLASGLGRDDKVAIIANNRPEYNILDIGIQQIGAISVPCYPTIAEEDFKFIFNDADVKMVFVSDEELYHKMKHIEDACPQLEAIYTFDHVANADHWSKFMDRADEQYRSRKDDLSAAVKPEDLFTIIYTSGTTGTPKGVMLTHSNLISNVKASLPLLPINHEHRVISFLPLNHVFERMIVFLYQSAGVSIYYAESMDTIGDNIREVKPHLFTAVPRLLEKVFEKIMAKGAELSGIKRFLFDWAVGLGLRYEKGGANGWWYETQLKLANKLIFSKWREALGGQVKAIVSGSAALQPRLARIFTAAQIIILEGYGLTETSPVVSTNCVPEEDRAFGTVGPVIEGVEVKIAEDGEILVKGPNVMVGYYKRQDLTDEVIDADGWFHTGDIGTFVDDRFLKITDRKKEIFKTSGGKYVAPQPIENKLKEDPFVEQIMIVGEYKKFVSALIVPSEQHLRDWCAEEGLEFTSMEQLVDHPKVIEAVQNAVDRDNVNFSHVEQIKKFKLLPTEWSVEAGELTPTMKMKRKVILAKFENEIDKLYEE